MTGGILVLAEYSDGQISKATRELLAAARSLASALDVTVEAALLGPASLASQLAGADAVISVDAPELTVYHPAAYELALTAVIEQRSPRALLMSAATAGLDLAPAIAFGWQAPLATSAIAIGVSEDAVTATCSLLGGKLLADVELPGDRAVVTVAAGAFRAGGDGATVPGPTPALVALTPPSAITSPAISLVRITDPPPGDIDIAAAPVLVSVGRGIGSADDIELVQELADALGAPVAASRPVVDAGWLPKSRQVGRSGQVVRPKAYLAFGISGAPEHLEGMRDAGLIIACNTDAAAPIFGVAHYGTTLDLLDLLPALTEAVSG